MGCQPACAVGSSDGRARRPAPRTCRLSVSTSSAGLAVGLPARPRRRGSLRPRSPHSRRTVRSGPPVPLGCTRVRRASRRSRRWWRPAVAVDVPHGDRYFVAPFATRTSPDSPKTSCRLSGDGFDRAGVEGTSRGRGAPLSGAPPGPVLDQDQEADHHGQGRGRSPRPARGPGTARCVAAHGARGAAVKKKKKKKKEGRGGGREGGAVNGAAACNRCPLADRPGAVPAGSTGRATPPGSRDGGRGGGVSPGMRTVEGTRGQ